MISRTIIKYAPLSIVTIRSLKNRFGFVALSGLFCCTSFSDGMCMNFCLCSMICSFHLGSDIGMDFGSSWNRHLDSRGQKVAKMSSTNDAKIWTGKSSFRGGPAPRVYPWLVLQRCFGNVSKMFCDVFKHVRNFLIKTLKKHRRWCAQLPK